MARTLPVCALVSLLLALSWLWAPVSAADSPPNRTVIRLTVQPMAAPTPALKYHLLPELTEMNPGNPALGYLKCFAEQNLFFFSKESVDKREKWLTMPLEDLPLEEVRHYGGKVLRRADEAARLDTLDWQILEPIKREGVNLVLPEIQQLRTLGAALKVRFRAEVAERRFDDALTTAKTLFALSRHMGEHPTPITNLVGMSVANLAVGPIEEMIRQPGCPNLYWALTELPAPLIDLRKGLQGERLMLDVELRVLDSSAPMSEEQIRNAIDRIRILLTMSEAPPDRRNPDIWLQDRVKDPGEVDRARKRLVESGVPEERVKAFPALQVILLDARRDFLVRRDEVMKWMSLPYRLGEPALSAASAREMRASLLMPVLRALVWVRGAHVRLDQRIALLRTVEALRLHAAETGKLPGSLAEIKVPVPDDPISGKPFVYKVEGGKAVLSGTPPRGDEMNAAYNMVYEVTLRK
jgi:hypothetical protein